MTLYGAFLDGHAKRFQVVEGLFWLIASDEAEISGAGCGVRRLGVEGMLYLVEVDLLLAELEAPTTVSFDGFKSEDASVEGGSRGDAGNREDEVVQPLYLHEVFPKGTA